MSHSCAIPGCKRPAKDGQLMCWPHWRRVPRALNRAVFDTYEDYALAGWGRGAEYTAYRSARQAAIDAVVEKERGS